MMSFMTLLLALAGCGSDKGESITVVGSSALQPLVEAAGEQYSGDHLGVFVNVQGGGSGTGLSQIQEGAVNIGNSDLFASEKTGIKASKLVDHKVAVVGITPVVNKKVNVKNLTIAQLRGIFTGRITNWRQVGGKNLPVVIVNRAQGSGTRATFERWVMAGQPALAAQEQDSTGMVRQIVASTPGAISYMAFSYVDSSIKTVKVDGIAPTPTNVYTNRWQIWAYEHMYTLGKPSGLTKRFLTYVQSDKIQNSLVKQMGYIPVNKMRVSRTVDGKVTQLP
ncbi:phosphate ABC transporter substrate-binding protein PstS family protein [Lacticaseibacillus songhuajiangensis]|jgi:phosphate transport system substrate-binding protein|uniref:phosphate ABC transporter substrate-binding protein PstS family protein n=1 Tax=Lacticaseibacillus songhuajiangensis TaxID=1296539 RepID=UPI000F76C719|nr:phosphate ABC transporter substrate-binding protein PstS family protein [Lacticaseibacillus songhuajiangensis]MCI1283951.1 phosphate ABC transporter substrate-binding protein PstS family protein [Lacticaseibacillus songhuajiangensis]